MKKHHLRPVPNPLLHLKTHAHFSGAPQRRATRPGSPPRLLAELTRGGRDAPSPGRYHLPGAAKRRLRRSSDGDSGPGWGSNLFQKRYLCKTPAEGKTRRPVAGTCVSGPACSAANAQQEDWICTKPRKCSWDGRQKDRRTAGADG